LGIERGVDILSKVPACRQVFLLDRNSIYLYDTEEYVKKRRGFDMLLEKTTRMNFLFDFYQALLTEKQRSYMQLYYLDDHSLGEIAEVYDVSRQAVYDNIRRTETMLEEYEEKLQLFEKFQNRQQILAKLTESITDVQSATADQLALIEQLKQCD